MKRILVSYIRLFWSQLLLLLMMMMMMMTMTTMVRWVF